MCITLRDKVCQWLTTGRWFSTGTPVTVSSTNKADRHYITKILLKVAFNTIKQTNISIFFHYFCIIFLYYSIKWNKKERYHNIISLFKFHSENHRKGDKVDTPVFHSENHRKVGKVDTPDIHIHDLSNEWIMRDDFILRVVPITFFYVLYFFLIQQASIKTSVFIGYMNSPNMYY